MLSERGLREFPEEKDKMTNIITYPFRYTAILAGEAFTSIDKLNEQIMFDELVGGAGGVGGRPQEGTEGSSYHRVVDLRVEQAGEGVEGWGLSRSIINLQLIKEDMSRFTPLFAHSLMETLFTHLFIQLHHTPLSYLFIIQTSS